MRRRRENAPLCAPFLLPKGREGLLPHLSHAKGKAFFSRYSGNFLFHKPHSWLLGLRGFTCSGGVGCGENPAAPIWGDCPAFFSVWTAKESYVKLLGRGIDAEFSSFSVVDEDALLERLGEIEFRQISLEVGYCMSLCGTELGEVRQTVFHSEAGA